ncbi:response regulator transcription factor [Novosphingobium rosa]|uniref:response regulator transcription factor n=1 Tax=Novosphingobium rosa TaxID=76978 RepID=UPI000A853CC8|nr:response regulator transcription factor [Novosphingobium rosa]
MHHNGRIRHPFGYDTKWDRFGGFRVMAQYTVLGIDDHRLFQAGLELLIIKNFPSVAFRAASCIEDALQAADLSPDLILLDLDLSGMSGIDGVPLLRLRWPQCRIVIVSAKIDISLMLAANDHGVDAFISKAEPPERVVEIIRALTLSSGQGERAANDMLTRRQTEIVTYLREGYSNKAIAHVLGISEFTVRGHVQTVMKAFGARNRTEVAFEAQKRGLL